MVGQGERLAENIMSKGMCNYRADEKTGDACPKVRLMKVEY
jgi:hypothetical protein